MARFLWICLGGAIGTGARYLVSGWVLQLFGPAFPWGTFAVNLIGSFLLGAIVQFGLASNMSDTLRLVLTTGCMGGFTTYSTFNLETLRYLQQGAWLLAALNIGGTLLACLLAGAAGIASVRWLIVS